MAKKLLLALFLNTDSLFSLSSTIIIHKWQITIAYAQIYILLECAQITVDLHILNLLLQQLVHDNFFYMENLHFMLEL
jgi:hypothetical protein